MNYRSVLLMGLLGGAGVVGSTSSCSGPDPGQITYSERPKGTTGDLTSGGTSGTSGVTPTDGGSSGAETGTEGGTSGLPVTAFTGAAPFDPAGASVGSSNVPASHPNGGNPAGVNCMTCHGPAGPANAKWGIAGTVYTTAAGATPLAKANLRIVDAKGKELASVYSDPLGNFWADTIVGGIPAGSFVGVRNATVTKLMTTALAAKDSGCQQAACHVAGAQGRVFLQ